MGTDQSPDPMYTALMGQRDTAVALATSRLLDLEECRRQLAEAIKDRDNSLKIANMNHAQWERAEASLKGAEGGRDAAVAALAKAPILSKFHGERGFELENFVEAYAGWRVEARATLASNSGGGGA